MTKKISVKMANFVTMKGWFIGAPWLLEELEKHVEVFDGKNGKFTLTSYRATDNETTRQYIKDYAVWERGEPIVLPPEEINSIIEFSKRSLV